MPPEVGFHRLAERELSKACDWYAGHDRALRDQLLAEVDAATERIATGPEQWPRYDQLHRWVRVQRFPYVLYYRILDETHVLVMAVAHTSRRPDYWRRRRPET